MPNDSSGREPIRLAHPSFSASLPARIGEILDSGVLVKGRARVELEAELCRAFDVPYAVTYSSGTVALVAALAAAGVGEGDRVAVPDYGFVATANAVKYLGATPVFVDVAGDFQIDPDALALVRGLAAVIVVHQFGRPARLADIQGLARDGGYRVVEDSACAYGTRVNGRPLGAQGGLGILSFHPRKLVTAGDGGALLTASEATYKKAWAFSDHGIVPGDSISTGVGLNLRLPEISCALALDGARRIEEIVAARRHVGEIYRQELAETPEIALPEELPGVEWNHQTFAVHCRDARLRDGLVASLAEADIEAAVPARSLSDSPVFASGGAEIPAHPGVSRRLTQVSLALPCHEKMRDEDVRRVASELKRCVAFL
ncbi:aminotransferase class I/II-fold pyridoxal phosphate-dependent enzyme [bacterium]|nr:aminotransferase class I/II-fold pyridoxal phosphate-dependent enzyme [bacterium]